VNTHSLTDHVAQNYLFDEVAIFDDPAAWRAAEEGMPHEAVVDILAEGLVWKPLPESFDADAYRVPPFKVTRWLHDGDIIDLGDRKLEVFHTPGHSPDSICLLDQDAGLFVRCRRLKAPATRLLGFIELDLAHELIGGLLDLPPC